MHVLCILSIVCVYEYAKFVSFVYALHSTNTFVGGAISGGDFHYGIKAVSDDDCNDNKFYGICVEPGDSEVAHLSANLFRNYNVTYLLIIYHTYFIIYPIPCHARTFNNMARLVRFS